MAKKYTGSLSLEWFNKQKSILVQSEEVGTAKGDVPAPKINWINKDEALFYEIVDDDGKGLSPFWVDRSDLRVKEARPLIFQKAYSVVGKQKSASLIDKDYKLVESNEDDPEIANILIQGDNLLALNALKKLLANRPDEEKVKCVYIDPPFNTGQAFEHYDDNLAHSEWLTLLRDRLVILHNLLSENGFLFLHLDNVNVHLARLLLDELFGRHNFLNEICYERSGSAGIGQGSELVDTAEFIVIYAKNKDVAELNLVLESEPLSREVMKRYNKALVEEGTRNLVTSFESKSNGEAVRIYSHSGSKIDSVSLRDFEQRENEIRRWYAKNFTRVFRTTNPQQENSFQQEIIRSIDSNLHSVEYIPSRGKNKGQPTTLFYLGNELFAWLKDTASLEDGEITKRNKLKTVWEHKAIPKADLANEGGVSFKRGKKPEQLIKRLLELATSQGDLVLDCFGGSGTTFAVAQKMNRRWIGVEIGKHATTHVLPRLREVLTGKDQSGISKSVNWEGGGSFKYYKLGDSIIDSGSRDFNWHLGRDFIEKSLLSSYDFVPDLEFSPDQPELINKKHHPSVGFHRIGQKQMAGVVSLTEPGQEKSLLYDEIMSLYDSLKKFKGTHSVTVFTNRGVELAYDSKPEDLAVVKVPHAIFAELEK
jgi:adenine-specific DNA-methyltransferase